MSYYFAIIGTKDNPLFEFEFGTAKHGGDGIARFREDARHLNQFIVHSSLDIVDEAQWTTGAMYLKSIDRFYNNYISCFLTGSGAKFLLLHCPDPNATYNAHANPVPPVSTSSTSSTSSRASSIATNPTSAAAEEAVRQFFADVYEAWVKTVMNPFYLLNMPVKSPIFKQRVAAAGKKYL